MSAPETKPWHDEAVVANILQSAFGTVSGSREITLPNGDLYQVRMKPLPGVDGVWFIVHRWDSGLQGRHFEVTVKEVKET